MISTGWWTLLAVSIAGGLGASARYGIDVLSKRLVPAPSDVPRFPWRLWLINVSGSFVIGIVAGLFLESDSLPLWGLVASTGFLGGYTTFSSVSYETVRLVQAGQIVAGATHAFLLLLVSFGAATVGVVLGVA